MTDELHAQAMNQIPGYDAANRQIEAATRWLKELRRFSSVTADQSGPTDDELVAAVAGDGVFPEGLGRRYLAAVERVRAREIEIHQVERFLADSKARLLDAQREGGEAALEYLGDALDDLVDELRDLAPQLQALPPLETIAETNDTAALALRKRRPELVSRYLAIRSAQESVTMVMLPSATDFDGGKARVTRALLSVGQVRDAIDAEKHWTAARKAAANANEATAPRELQKWYTDTPKPVLSAVEWNAPLPNTDVDGQTAALLNIVINSTPWIPGPDQLEAVMQESESATGVVWRDSDGPRILASIAALAKVSDPEPTRSRW